MGHLGSILKIANLCIQLSWEYFEAHLYLGPLQNRFKWFVGFEVPHSCHLIKSRSIDWCPINADRTRWGGAIKPIQKEFEFGKFAHAKLQKWLPWPPGKWCLPHCSRLLLDAPLVFIEQLGGGAAGAKSGWLEPHLPHIGSPTSCWISATGPAASALPCCLSGFVYCKTLSFVLQGGGGGGGGGGGKGGIGMSGKFMANFSLISIISLFCWRARFAIFCLLRRRRIFVCIWHCLAFSLTLLW